MKRPNFYIIGAPKSGTTSLSVYLGEHPNVFIPREKEPNFWNDDFHNVGNVTTLDEYLDLFREAAPHHSAIGEASVNYLHSTRAIPRIFAFDPHAKLVVLLRNPVDLAYSWHSQMLYGFYEDERDFERAWALQHDRALGRHIPRRCREPKVLQYREIASLGKHMTRVLDIFPREQVQICLFDDFVSTTGAVYRTVLRHLGLEDDGRTEFPVINENKTHASAALGAFAELPPRFWTAGARLVRKGLGVQQIGLLRRIREMNRVPVRRPALAPEFRARLLDEFRADIDTLAQIVGRDLNAWRSMNLGTDQGATSERLAP